MPAVPLHLSGRPDVPLTADCTQCFALCCSALGFERSSDFAHDKPAGEPCRNLATDFSCTIHARLRSSGYRGCTVFDCFGAGQQVAQRTFGGRSWTDHPELRSATFTAFPIVRQLHEVLWYLDEAQRLADTSTAVPGDIRALVGPLVAETVELAQLDPAGLAAVDLDGLRGRVGPALGAVSGAVRNGVRGVRLSRRLAPGADLLGADLTGRDLRGANLRGAYLIAADLSGADLRWVDLLGADLRDARLHGADLSHALFLTPLQLAAAAGDESTRLPTRLSAPAHWG
ncbi:pentapeptide repeat-containing protein [Arthrobacter echini]|uniref:Pentapeptide repeat-containing protein n=1 Tax=Arthrobacter echini TaxID=1529066 RepID=A0A4S5E7H2_9MICC|nr:pentapeptide repeat-containing protein [Arthrobacter echini]THJ67452.1 pentapeptide repeat-containing protein [Arthrobacter echini]